MVSPPARSVPLKSYFLPAQTLAATALVEGASCFTVTVTVESQPSQFCSTKACVLPPTQCSALVLIGFTGQTPTSMLLLEVAQAATFTVTMESQPSQFEA